MLKIKVHSMLEKVKKLPTTKYSFLMFFILLSGINVFMHYKVFTKELVSFHVWRQTQTQSTIINFYEEDFNILNPRRNNRGDGDGIFRMEFPIMQWLFAGAYKIFGNHLIISRILSFIIGLLTLLGFYHLLINLFQKKIIALIGIWALNFSPSFYYYTVNPMPDNFALCCSIWGVSFFFLWLRNKKLKFILISGLFLSLGTLSKLPFILYFILPCSFFIQRIIRKEFIRKYIISLLLIGLFLVPPGIWYIIVIPQWHGNGIVQGMLNLRVPFSTIFDYLQHNLISSLPELLLNYGSVPFFLAGFYFIIRRKVHKNQLFFPLTIWSSAILAYFIFEINMIAKVHDYYLFPFYPVLFIIVSYGAYQLFTLHSKFWDYLVLFCLIVLPFTCHLRMKNRWDTDSPGFNKDLLIYKHELRNAVPKNDLCVAGNDISCFIFFYYIDKKGWCFNNNLNALEIEGMINKGAKYLYSDCRSVDENTNIQKYLDHLILEKGSVRIYSLRTSDN